MTTPDSQPRPQGASQHSDDVLGAAPPVTEDPVVDDALQQFHHAWRHAGGSAAPDSQEPAEIPESDSGDTPRPDNGAERLLEAATRTQRGLHQRLTHPAPTLHEVADPDDSA